MAISPIHASDAPRRSVRSPRRRISLRVNWEALSVLLMFALQFAAHIKGACALRQQTLPFIVNDFRDLSQGGPSLGFLNDGNIFVAWHDQNNSIWDVNARVVAPDGTPLTPDFDVSESVSDHVSPVVLPLESTGGAAVLWRDSQGVWMRRYSFSYTPIGASVQMHTAGANVAACVFSPGRFMAVWDSEGVHGVGRRIYNDDGTPDDIPRQVQLPPGCSGRVGAYPSCISKPGGGAIIHFQSSSSLCPGLFRATIDSNGIQAADALEITSNRAACGINDIGCLYFPLAIPLFDGRFFLAWFEKNSQWTSFCKGQFFARDWSSIGGEVLIHNTSEAQHTQFMTDLPSGHILIGWYEPWSIHYKAISGTDGSDLSILYSVGGPSSSEIAMVKRGDAVALGWSNDALAPFFRDIYAQVFSDVFTPLTTGSTGSTGSTGTTGTTGQLPATPSGASSPAPAAGSSSSSPLPLILGVTLPVTACLAFSGFAAVYLRRSRRGQGAASSVGGSEFGMTPLPEGTHGSLSSSRMEGQTVIGGRYELLKRLRQADAAILEAQTGIALTFPPGKRKVEVCLGEGRQGKVRVAKNLSTGVFCAVKKMSGEEMEIFGDEGVIGNSIKGLPNVLETYDYVRSEGSDGLPKYYQFMLLASGDGGELVTHLQPLDPAVRELMVTDVGAGLARGLAAMHGKNVYHLDFKAENFVRDKHGVPYICDFGCAKMVADGIVSEFVTGDTRYFPNERLDASRELALGREASFAAAPIDAWALGVTLLELLVGYYPFDLATVKEKYTLWNAEYFRGKLSSYEVLQNPVIGSLAEVILGLLNYDPSRRYTVNFALEKLEALLHPSAAETRAEQFAQLPIKPQTVSRDTASYNNERDQYYNPDYQ